MKVITRFAPSPTGMLHIGGARTALFNYLFSKHHNGKFLLRIEDTDEKRSNHEAKKAIIEGLDWLGLEFDDDIVNQSENVKYHQEIAYQLLKEDKAYLCYVSSEELKKLREDDEKKGKVFRFKSPYRDQKPKMAPHDKPVIRLKTKQEGINVINDLVQGEVRVANSEIEDFIILRSDQSPTYNLAVVADDHKMKITHVIRGDDHLNNSFKQKLIYEAMNWTIPNFAHIPLIHGSDGAKMSKRHGATCVIDYKKMGYLAISVRNYLLRLGWSHGDKEIISDEEAIKYFDLNKVGKSPSRFDFAKLNNINKHYLKELSNDKLFNMLNFDLKGEKKEKFLLALSFVRERSSTLNDICDNLKIYHDDFKENISHNDQEKINNKKEILRDLKEIIQNINDWQLDLIKEELLNYATNNGLKMKDFGPVLRIVLTYSSSSAGGIFEIIDLLGQKETLKRINYEI